MGGLVMTIEEKAQEYIKSDEMIFNYMEINKSDIKDAFVDGAKWMLEKASDWIAKQGSKANDGVVMICVEDFQKAMEEE